MKNYNYLTAKYNIIEVSDDKLCNVIYYMLRGDGLTHPLSIADIEKCCNDFEYDVILGNYYDVDHLGFYEFYGYTLSPERLDAYAEQQHMNLIWDFDIDERLWCDKKYRDIFYRYYKHRNINNKYGTFLYYFSDANICEMLEDVDMSERYAILSMYIAYQKNAPIEPERRSNVYTMCGFSYDEASQMVDYERRIYDIFVGNSDSPHRVKDVADVINDVIQEPSHIRNILLKRIKSFIYVTSDNKNSREIENVNWYEEFYDVLNYIHTMSVSDALRHCPYEENGVVAEWLIKKSDIEQACQWDVDGDIYETMQKSDWFLEKCPSNVRLYPGLGEKIAHQEARNMWWHPSWVPLLLEFLSQNEIVYLRIPHVDNLSDIYWVCKNNSLVANAIAPFVLDLNDDEVSWLRAQSRSERTESHFDILLEVKSNEILWSVVQKLKAIRPSIIMPEISLV